jgi:rhamnogalacturonan endolyase
MYPRHVGAMLACLIFSTLTACGDAEDPQPTSRLAITAAGVFGLTTDSNFYTVDTGAGLVFKIRRLDNGSSTQSAGDIASMVYNGVEFQDQTRGSQLNSGFDYLYNGISAVTVDAVSVGSDYIKITVKAGDLTHYYMAERGSPHIYMGTHFTREPDTLNLARFIMRIPIAVLPNGPTPSNIRNNTGAIESGDIFGLANGETRSKHYSNMRLKDWSHIGATGTHVGVWMVRDNHEGGSGGPFYRSLLNQGTDTSQELTYIINYGEAQTEAYRLGILNTYTLAFTSGAAPGAIDTSWFANMGLTGYIGANGRGRVTGVGITGRDTSYTYTVGFANTTAQYWTTAAAADGYFNMPGMIPGTYTMKIYKNELAVDSRSVTVTAGGTHVLNTLAITGDPSSAASLWRIGQWDGSPAEFLNGGKVTTMHPSDVRMSSWTPAAYVVGTSTPATGFPAYQWKSVNGAATVKFSLTASQLAAHTLRIGITTAFSGARPQVTVNSWVSTVPAASTQPTSRTLTVGTYRGNNTTFNYAIPSTAFVVGTNTLTIAPASGSTGTTYLSPGYSFDAVDLL